MNMYSGRKMRPLLSYEAFARFVKDKMQNIKKSLGEDCLSLHVYSMYLSVTQQNRGTRAFSKNLRMGMRGKTNKQTVIQRRKGRVSFIINK